LGYVSFHICVCVWRIFQVHAQRHKGLIFIEYKLSMTNPKVSVCSPLTSFHSHLLHLNSHPEAKPTTIYMHSLLLHNSYPQSHLLLTFTSFVSFYFVTHMSYSYISSIINHIFLLIFQAIINISYIIFMWSIN